MLFFYFWKFKHVTFTTLFRNAYTFSLFASLSVFVATSHAQESAEKTNKRPSQVSFADVTALTYTPMTEKIVYGEDKNQFIEVWAANKRAKVAPVSAGLILVHGGCWLADYGVDHVRALASALSDKSYNVFAVEYRRTGQSGGGWPGSLNDVRASIKKVRDTYPKMALSVVGHSAGGHLAVLTGTDPTLRLSAVIGMAAITDMSSYAKGDSGCEQAAVKFMGGEESSNKQAYALANTRDKRIVVPLYLLGSEADKIVPVEQIKHDQARHFVGGNIGHFDWVHPETEAFQHLLNTLSRLYE